ncbi:MAG: acyl-CoA synthetase [Deltaproteobacteria bacterium]|nr:acyl-CoA synthetase [Deltaproteobacteria bacterium]
MSWNIGDIFAALGPVLGEEPALIHGSSTDARVVTWAELDRRSNALANALVAGGARPDDKVAIYSYNRPEWMETVVACFKARLVPVNVNYRYRDDELEYLLDNCDAAALVFEGCFADNVARLAPRLAGLRQLIQLDDGSPRLAGSLDYEELVSGPSAPLDIERSPDDLLLLYTGGTTGMPKGVMWRQEDVWHTLGAGGDPLTGQGRPADVPEHVAKVVVGDQRQRLLPACPLMHGTGFFTAVSVLMNGGAIVTTESRKLDTHLLWSAVQARAVTSISIVGDVFARPMVAALRERSYDLSSLRLIISSGVMWSIELKRALLDFHPNMILFDSLGSSEATGLGASIMVAGMEMPTASFKVGDRVKVFTEDGREVAAGSGERGLVARSGPIPLGYYKDPDKSARTFPTIGGVRWSMPGDFATVESDGTLRLLGRGSVCINTGGEKVFPEEVEEVLKRHPMVEDAAVVGLADEKWGQAIHAMVVLREGGAVAEEELRDHVRGLLAGYKVPKRIFAAESLGRSPSGKMDYKSTTARILTLSQAPA